MNYSDQQYTAAREAFSSGQMEEALELVENCITVLRKSVIFMKKREGEDFIRYIDAKMLQGRIHAELKQDDKVDQVLDHIRQLSIGAEAKTDAFLKGKINYFFFDVEWGKGNEDDALNYLDKSREYFIKSENYQSAIDIIFDLVNVRQYPDQDSYLELYKDVRKLSDKLNKVQKLENSGKAKLQIAKVLSRYDNKNAKKTVSMASKDLSETPDLLIQSHLFFMNLYIRTDPGKVADISKKLAKTSKDSQYKFPIQLYENISAIMRRESHELDNGILSKVAELPQEQFMADTLLEITRLLVLYSDIPSDDLQQLVDYCHNTYSSHDDKLGITAAFLMNAIISKDIENKLKLVQIYSKSLNTSVISHLRPITMDLIQWVFTSDIDQLVKEIERTYEDKIQRAETIYLLSQLKIADGKELETIAEKMFSKTKLKSVHKISL